MSMGEWGSAGNGALQGAGTGAMIGSIIPGVGTAVGGVVGGLFGGIGGWLSGHKQTEATQAQLDSVRQAQGQIQDYTNQSLGYQQPYYEQGAQDYATLRDMVGNGSFDTNKQMQNWQTDPGYQFRLQQGQNGINSSAAANGGLLSGATLKALSKYNQDFASNEYQNVYNRTFQNNQQNYSMRNNLAGYGEQAASNMSNIASRAGTQMADLTTQGGNARAAGDVAQANNFNNGMSNLAQMGMYYKMMNGNGLTSNNNGGGNSGNILGGVRAAGASY